MGLDERSRAADSLASVLAVYDGFCNLKQVRPSQSSPGKKMSPFFFSALHYPRVVLRSFDDGRSKL
jgi:hypothetical protein